MEIVEKHNSVTIAAVVGLFFLTVCMFCSSSDSIVFMDEKLFPIQTVV